MKERVKQEMWVPAQYAGDLWRVAEVTSQGSLRLEPVDGGAERVEFIRRTAIAASTLLHEGQGLCAHECWDVAKKLWAAKPEDC
jgi:hypothetical protein